MNQHEVLQLNVEDLNTLTMDDRKRVAYVARSIRGIVYGIDSDHGRKNWERVMGMSIEQTKIHTLGLLTRMDELNDAN